MLHELLFALQGYTGSIFIEKEDDIEVMGDISFLHPSEESLLNKLCLLGTHYKFFSHFITRHLKPSDIPELYLQALSSGLDQVLANYRQDLIDLETEIFKDPHLSLSHIYHSLQRYFLLFPNVKALIVDLESRQVRGCRVLDVVYEHTHSGIPFVKKAINKIFRRCHAVFYRQLCAWMLYGLLTDPCQEFFIREAAPAEDGKEESTAQPQTQEKRYEIRTELLPSYISSSVADKILFVGEAVCLLASSNAGSVPGVEEGLEKSHREEFAGKFRSLAQQEEFLLFQLEATVSNLRDHAAQTLWRLVVEEGQLLAQLRLLKELYLLGRGELALALLEAGGPLLRLPPSPQVEQAVCRTFQSLARTLLPEDCPAAEKVSLTLTPSEGEKQESGWDCVGLRYEVASPLSMFLTPEILSRYNTIYRFLLSIHRVQRELQLCWLEQIKSGVSCALRFHMTFLIDSLQSYLQVDVLESNFQLLQEKIRTIQDFESIRTAHDQFLTDITAQSFLFLKPVHVCLQEILRQCLSFSQLVMSGFLTSQLQEEHNKAFSKQAGILVMTLSTLHRHQSLPQLSQLLLRINFNRFFSPSS